MAASVPLDGEYGETGIFCGVPAVIGIHGVEQVMEYNLPTTNCRNSRSCCQTIRNNIAKAAALLK